MGLGAAGVALAVPLPSLPVSRPVGCWWVLWRFPSLPPRWRLLAPALPLRCLSAPLFLPPGLGLAVPPGLVLGCCPWLPLPLDTVFWFLGEGEPGLALGRCGAVRGGAGADSRARFFI